MFYSARIFKEFHLLVPSLASHRRLLTNHPRQTLVVGVANLFNAGKSG